MLFQVRTRKDFYQVDVLSSKTREVLVRGGIWLKNWTPAVLQAGPGGRWLDDVSAIPVGRPLVLRWNDHTLITSPVVSVEKHK